MIWKTLCHFSWLNKIDWIFAFYLKVTLACLKWPSRESAALLFSWDRIYILSLADVRVRCLLKQKNTLCHQQMTVPAPLYGNAKSLYGSSEVSFQFPIRLLSNGAFSLSPFMWRLGFQAKSVMMSACSSDWLCSVTDPRVFVGGVFLFILST